MTLHAFDTTVNRIPGTEVTVTVPIYSTEPGIVTAAAPGCTFPDGESVVIAGTRTWRNGLKHGQYLARPNCCQLRDTATWCVEVDTARLVQIGLYSAQSNVIPLIASFRTDALQRTNWRINLFIYYNNVIAHTARVYYWQSNDASTAEASHQLVATQNIGGELWAAPVIKRFVIYANADKLYITDRTDGAYVGAAVTRIDPAGTTMGGNEALRVENNVRFTKHLAELTQQQRADWNTSGVVTPGAEIAILGGHEIVESAPVFWDSSGTNDLYNYQIINVSAYPAAASGDYTDAPGDPVVPASSIRVTIPAGVASPVTLTLTRPRQGVPARASEAEKTESTTGTITIVDIPAVVHVGPPQIVSAHLNENPVAYCHITTDRPGTVTITCDRTIIDFPATVVVDASLEATMEGAILKGGDCDVTGAM